jgi:hypothetical protein
LPQSGMDLQVHSRLGQLALQSELANGMINLRKKRRQRVKGKGKVIEKVKAKRILPQPIIRLFHMALRILLWVLSDNRSCQVYAVSEAQSSKRSITFFV